MDIKKIIGWCIKGIIIKVKKMPKVKKKLLIVSIVSLMIGLILGNGIGKSAQGKKAEKAISQAVTQAVTDTEKKDNKKIQELEKQIYDLKEQLQDEEVELPWNLILVNYENPMGEGYAPKLMELEEGYSVDSRILDATKQMLKDAKAAGVNIEICSAYRSVERQEQVFSDSMKERVRAGLSYWEAYSETAINVAVPGTSEHALGLALDLISSEYSQLDEAQENTAEAKWLKENCHKYGFILRYPPQKTSITGITYEPWHYRYVGVKDATKIMELGITLEEYLQEYYFN